MGQSSQRNILENIVASSDKVVIDSGYFALSSGDFSAVTGGFLATKTVDLFSFSASQPGDWFGKRPDWDAWHYTKNGSSSTIYDGTSFDVHQMDFVEFNDRSTGEVDRAGNATLIQTFSNPVFTVKLQLAYFTRTSTGFSWSTDANNLLFYLIYSTNIVQAFPPS